MKKVSQEAGIRGHLLGEFQFAAVFASMVTSNPANEEQPGQRYL
jgi:hypothetical protein